MINIGIIGTGDVADRWLAPAVNLLPEAKLWSVLSREENRGKKFANRHKASSSNPVLTDLGQFLSDPDLHAVIIATPDNLHAAQAISAANNKKHLFVEKPMATNVADANEIVEICKGNEVKLAVGYHHRFHSGHALLRERINQNILGEILHARFHWTYDYSAEQDSWRAKGNKGRWWSLAALGTHCIDLANWLLGSSCGEISTIPHAVTKDNSAGRDESAIVTWQYGSGATVEIFSSVLFKSKRIIEIYGTKGNAICEWTLGPRGGGTIVINGGAIVFTEKNPYKEELADFVDSIITGRNPAVDGLTGLRNVQILEGLKN
ncbi:MAG: Gfo/Idh/MocA family oxidoreductase [Candidatus Vogelbacteria bacterium]|nr:Gfo/Idh/MocA family oxidoreductase [Candidatus Vogelbacteria bacterium]